MLVASLTIEDIWIDLGAIILGVLSLFIGYYTSKIILEILHELPRFLRNIIAIVLGFLVAYFAFIILFYLYYFWFLVAITPEDRVSLEVPGYRIEMAQETGSEPFTYTDLYMTICRKTDRFCYSETLRKSSYAPQCHPKTQRVNKIVYFLCENQNPSEEALHLDTSNLTLYFKEPYFKTINKPLASFDYKLNYRHRMY